MPVPGETRATGVQTATVPMIAAGKFKPTAIAARNFKPHKLMESRTLIKTTHVAPLSAAQHILYIIEQPSELQNGGALNSDFTGNSNQKSYLGCQLVGNFIWHRTHLSFLSQLARASGGRHKSFRGSNWYCF